MTEILQFFLGDFYGRMLAILIDATQYTIYLSLVAFVGGGFIGLIMTVLKIVPSRIVRAFATTYIVLALKPPRNQFSSTLSAWVLRGIRNIGCQIAALEVDFKLNFGPETGRSGQISRFGDDSTHLAPGACGQS